MMPNTAGLLRCLASCLLPWALLAASPARAQSLWELTPYRVQVYVSLARAPQLTPHWKKELDQAIVDRCEATVGPVWQLELAAPSAELDRKIQHGIGGVTQDDLPVDSLEHDKVVLLGVSTVVDGYRLSVREFDANTRLWGTAVAQHIGQPALLRDAAPALLVKAFAPLTRIETVDGKQTSVRLRAASLPTRDPSILWLREGAILRPVLRFNDREGKIRADRAPQPLPWTWLEVQQLDDTTAHCALHSGLRSPLSSRRRGRIDQLAVRVLPPDASTDLVVQSRSNPDRRLYGYEVFAYSPDSPVTTLLGRTDRQGTLRIEPSEHPLRILVIKSGGEFLARLPLVPGVEPQALATVQDDDDRLAVEGFIHGIQGELIDLVARRAVLLSRIRSRIDSGELEEAEELLFELRRLRTLNEMAAELNEYQRKIFVGDVNVRRKIDQLFGDTREVLVRNLDPREIDQIASELRQARTTSPASSAAPSVRPQSSTARRG